LHKLKYLYHKLRGVAIFAKACFGHPSPSKQQKLNATANAFGKAKVTQQPIELKRKKAS
jgi:hypothetical protein